MVPRRFSIQGFAGGEVRARQRVHACAREVAGRASAQGAPCFGQLPPDLVFDAVPLLPGQLQRLLRHLPLSPEQPHGIIAACVCGCCHPMAMWSTPYQVRWSRVSEADGKVYLHQVPDAFSKAALLPEGLAQQVIALQSRSLPHRADCACCGIGRQRRLHNTLVKLNLPMHMQCSIHEGLAMKGMHCAPSCCEGRA